MKQSVTRSDQKLEGCMALCITRKQYSQMDQTIENGQKIIQKKQITAKNKNVR